jgi:hypothetical protein
MTGSGPVTLLGLFIGISISLVLLLYPPRGPTSPGSGTRGCRRDLGGAGREKRTLGQRPLDLRSETSG